MRKLLLACVCMCGIALNAVAADKTPDWINGTSNKYPADSFIIGVGIADTVDAARSAARAEIAKVFKARVAQSAQETAKERSTYDGKTSGSVEAQMTTKVSTDEILQGVEIAETWTNPKNRTQYALAVLNKVKLRTSLAQDLLDAEETVAAQIKSADAAASVIDKIRALTAALAAMDKKTEIGMKKRVVDPVAVPDVDAGTNRVKLVKQREAAMNKLRFVVFVENDTNNIKSTVGKSLTSAGFKVLPAVPAVPEAGSAVVLITCGIEVEPVDRGNPQWKFYNWKATGEMKESTASESFATINQEGQSSHITDDGARKKAIQESITALGTAVDEQINSYILGK